MHPSDELTPRREYLRARGSVGLLRARLDYAHVVAGGLREKLGDGFDAKLERVGETAERAAYEMEKHRLEHVDLVAFNLLLWDESEFDEFLRGLGGQPE